MAAQKVDEVMKYLLAKEDIEALVVFGLSFDNITKRSSEEMDPVYRAQEDQYIRWVDDPFLTDHRVRVRFAGEFAKLRRSRVLPGGLPESYLKAMRQLEEATDANLGKDFYVLIGYSSRIELSRSRIEEQEDQLIVDQPYEHNGDSMNMFSLLEVPMSLDLVIRTGKEQRVSDCLLYQMAYSELIFLDKFFPEINERDLELCLQEFRDRPRRYGR